MSKKPLNYDEEMQQAARSAAASVHDDFWDEVQRLQLARTHPKPKVDELVSKRPMNPSV